MGSLGKQVVNRAEEMEGEEVNKALEEGNRSEGEEFCFAIILSKFVVLSSF